MGFGTLPVQFSGSLRVNDPFLGALCPSKSGPMNKHIVKHVVCVADSSLWSGYYIGWLVIGDW